VGKLRPDHFSLDARISPQAGPHRAPAGLHARLAPDGHILLMITRKTPETKVFIESWWHAERYTNRELLQAVGEAGFRSPNFCRFPWRYFWLNRANYVVEAREQSGPIILARIGA
jgi:hypothetical protein